MSTKKIQIIGNLGNKIYTQNEEPIDAPEGALWLDLNEESQGSSGAGSVQSDWNQIDPTADDYIKNKPFYYGDMYVEDLVLPVPDELHCVVNSSSDKDEGYALLGYKATFEVGKSYVLEVQVVLDGVTYTENVNLTAYPLTALGFSSIFSEAVVLIDAKQTPYIVSGVTAKDVNNFSDITLADDTQYVIIKSKSPTLNYTFTCKGYNNIVKAYRKIDINYLPMEQIGTEIELLDASIQTRHLADGSVTTEKIADNSVTEVKIGEKALSGNVLQDGIIESRHLVSNSVLDKHIQSISADKITGKWSYEKIRGCELISNSGEITEPVTYFMMRATPSDNSYWEELYMNVRIYPTYKGMQNLIICWDSSAIMASIPIDFSDLSCVEVYCWLKAVYINGIPYVFGTCSVFDILSTPKLLLKEQSIRMHKISQSQTGTILCGIKGEETAQIGKNSSMMVYRNLPLRK